MPFSVEVPIYLRDEKMQQNTDAVQAAKREANSSDALLYTPLNSTIELPRSVSTDNWGRELAIELIYVTFASDIFDFRSLEAIREIEEKVLKMAAWRRYCALDWGTRAKEASKAYEHAVLTKDYAAIRQFQSTEFLSKMPCVPPSSVMWGCFCPEGTYTTQCRGGNNVVGCDVTHPWRKGPTDITPSSLPVKHAADFPPRNFSMPSYPPGLLNCRRPDGCHGIGDTNSLFDALDKDYVHSAIQHYARADPYADWSVLRFLFGCTDSTFGGGRMSGRALRSVFTVGLPIDGYSSAEDRQDEQMIPSFWTVQEL
eukprot:gene57294-biopygen5220